MNLKKEHLQDISELVFTGYLTVDVFVLNSYFSIRSLTQNEKTTIYTKYKYLNKSYNFNIILELLSKSLMSLGGNELQPKVVYKFLLNCNSNFILFLYNHYNKLDERIEEAASFLDYYIESQESKNFWSLFKNQKFLLNLNEVKLVNNFQYYWIVVNSLKDSIQQEKKHWSRTEYMTNSICSFVNPREFRRLKDQMSVTEKLYDDKDDEKKSIVESIENSDNENEQEIKQSQPEQPSSKIVSADKDIFDALARQQNESKEEYGERVSQKLAKHLKGEEIDDHDKAIRKYEINILKKLIYQKRIKAEVSKFIYERRKESEKNLNELSLEQDKESYLEKEELNELTEQEKKDGFYHNNTSYLEIICDKGFMSIPRDSKQKVFDEVMAIKIDVEKEADKYLKLYKQEHKVEQQANNSTDSSPSRTNSKDVKVAQKAAEMNVKVENKDLFKERSEKKTRHSDLLDRRKAILENDNDQIFFK